MKKAAILSINDLRHITMIRIYTDYFEKRGIPYEIICSDRYGDKEIKYGNAEVHSFSVAGNDASKARKLWDYIKFRRFALRILKEKEYGYVVVWNERTMALFANFLKNYSPYSVNIRDIWFPKNPIFKNNYNKAVKHCDFATWCAQRGVEYLPKHEYVTVLNQNKNLVKGAKEAEGFVEAGKPINIGVVGYIRHEEESKQFMKAFCNDSRYIIHFCGNGANHLRKYAEEIGMKNIVIVDSFKPEQTIDFLNQFDVINSYIGDGKKHLDQALGAPIRFGYSTLLYKPAIVSPNTFLSERTKELNIAFTAEKTENLADSFYEWYHSLDFERFKVGCDEYNMDYDKSMSMFWEACDERIVPIILGDRND